MTTPNSSSAYRDAGVDTAGAQSALLPLLDRLRGTWGRGNVELDMGHFANVVDLGGVGVAISTDGVGTKTVVADLLGRYDTVGYDCVAVNVNDVIAVGAEPNAFVDYVAVQRADDAMMDQIGAGLCEGAALTPACPWSAARPRSSRSCCSATRGATASTLRAPA